MDQFQPAVAWCMKQTVGLMEPVVHLVARRVPVPRFLVRLEPWHRVFLRNLTDLLWPRRQPPLRLSSRPGKFWHDVFVASRLPWRRFFESAFYHVAVLAALWGTAQLWPRRPVVVERPVFTRADVVYYDAAEYLPPLDTGGGHVHLQQKGEPEYSPQPIISVPPEADNRTQTIVTPPDLKLNHDVPMPNIVAWSQTQVAMPLAATARSAAELKLPALPTSVIAPPPEISALSPLHAAYGPQPAIIEPPPRVDTTIRRLGDINMGRAEVVPPAPQLPVAEQRAMSSMARAPMGNAGPAVVPPPPTIPGTGPSDGGRLIALGIHPVVPSGPIAVPAGNRRGTFAATPEGKPGAPGTPDLSAGDSHAMQAGVGTNHGSGNGAGSGKSTNGVPSGLLVGAAPTSSAVVGHAQGAGTGGASPSSNDSRLLANATPPRITSIPRRPSEVSDSNATELEKKVFGDRKFYSMTLNMPNLNSAGGSWVIRFAELNQTANSGELAAPVATQEVDPAYPTELMRRNVQGTVTLYAVIHSDGSVGEVRVLRGIDDRLDEYACAALSRWRFRPATKNGNAVDLEAVVMIPFRPIPRKPSF